MGSPTLGPRRKVLFVEDESTLRRTYKRFFAERYHLAFAASGTEARRQLDEFHPQVLVLDLRLPDASGLRDPSATASPVYNGTEPQPTNTAPRVIQAEVMY